MSQETTGIKMARDVAVVALLLVLLLGLSDVVASRLGGSVIVPAPPFRGILTFILSAMFALANFMYWEL